MSHRLSLWPRELEGRKKCEQKIPIDYSDRFCMCSSNRYRHTAEAGEKSKGPITLETMGVFWVGGQIVDRTDPALAGHKILSGATYVEYFIPQNKTTIPVIIAHRVIPGVIFQATTDGREGWAQYFVRQGFPVYIVDSLGTGRAGFELDQINLAATGQIPPLASNPLDPTTDSDTWVRFQNGTGVWRAWDGISLGNQMTTDPEALRRFLGAVGLPRRLPFLATLSQLLVSPSSSRRQGPRSGSAGRQVEAMVMSHSR